MYPRLTIVTHTHRGKPTKKSRTFSVDLLAYMTAPEHWHQLPGASQDAELPIWIAYAGTDAELNAFSANFRAGRRAAIESRHRRRTYHKTNDHLLVAKSAPLRWHTYRLPTAAVTLGYLPSLFHLDPLPANDLQTHLTWILTPPLWWLDQAEETLRPDWGHVARDVARAAYCTAFLDRRTPLPILRDLEFQLRLYQAALQAPFVSRAGDTFDVSSNFLSLGLDEPIAFHVTPQEIQELLRTQTQAYHEHLLETGRLDAPSSPHPSLPLPPSDFHTQLTFDFAVAS